MSKIGPEEFSKALEQLLEDYAEVTEEAVMHGLIQTADECVDDLKSANPPGSGHYRSWKRYNGGWSRTKLSANKKKGFTTIIHNKYYQLTHLLENGHALKGGGRAAAFEHIAPAERKAQEKLSQNIIKQIK